MNNFLRQNHEPLAPVAIDNNKANQNLVTHKKVEVYYCNCCGEEFTSESKDVVCPNCLCEYDEENGFIEKYTTILDK